MQANHNAIGLLAEFGAVNIRTQHRPTPSTPRIPVESSPMRSFLFTSALLITATFASAADDGTQLTIEQWVSQDSHGDVSGRIVLPTAGSKIAPINGVDVVLTSQDGKLFRASSETNANGEFKIFGAPSGVYTLVARGERVFAACAFHIVSATENKLEKRHQTAEIAAANIDFTDVKTSIIRYMPTSVAKNATFEASPAEKVMTSFVEENAFRVAQKNGGMNGRLFQAGLQGDQFKRAGLSNVFVYENGEAVAQTVSREDGTFEIDSLSLGQYSLMTIGPDGLGITSFELVDEGELVASSEESNGESLVALQSGCCCCPQFEMQVAPCAATETIVSDVLLSEGEYVEGGLGGEIIADGGIPIDGGMVADPLAAGYGGGSFGGGGGSFGGGGGGGFGGGGFGGIASLAGLGIGVAALASSDDDNAVIQVPAPASPALP